MSADKINSDTSAFDDQDSHGNRITWDPSAMELRIEGTVCRDGSVEIGNANSDNQIDYTGTGTLYASDDMKISTHLIPQSDYLQDDNLGLIAAKKVEIMKTKLEELPRIFGAVYGAEMVKFNDGGWVAGAVMAAFVDFDGSSGGIIQVPELAYNLPPGMLGRGPGTGGSLTVTSATLADWYQQ